MRVPANKLLEFAKTYFEELQIPTTAQIYVRDQLLPSETEIEISPKVDKYTKFALRGKVYKEDMICNIWTIRRGTNTKLEPRLNIEWVKFLTPYMTSTDKDSILSLLNNQMYITKTRFKFMGYDETQINRVKSVLELNQLIKYIDNTPTVSPAKNVKKRR